MFDFRLTVFYTVATRLSFTKAAEEINISQPAVSKHIRELEYELKTQLFIRKGNSIEMTPSGKLLLQYVEKLRSINRDFEFELNGLEEIKKGHLKIGSSTTIAQYVLPELLAKFNQYYPQIRIELVVSNSEKISGLLEKNKIDMGFVEGKMQSISFTYEPFRKDEIVLVTSVKNRVKKLLSIEDLYHYEFVTREIGSGTQEYIEDAFRRHGYRYGDLQTVIDLGSSEAMKNYLIHSKAFAFLSVSSVFHEVKNNLLQVIDIDSFSIPREFYSMVQTGEQSPIVELFLKTISHN